MTLFGPGDPRPIHFMGIAGAGMVALALVARRRGLTVTGCDADPAGAADLALLGVDVRPGHDPGHVEGARAVVVTAAVPPEHPELARAAALGIPVIKRAQALGQLVAGGGGMPIFHKQAPTFLLVNGRRQPHPIRMTTGVPNRLRLVSIHADEILSFRFGTETAVARWTPVARDGADLPSALRVTQSALVRMGPGETADFSYTPADPGPMQLEVWITRGVRIVLPVIVEAQKKGAARR